MTDTLAVPESLRASLRERGPVPTVGGPARRPRAARSTVCVRSVFTPCTGYGQVAEWLCRGLEQVGHRVALQDYGYDAEYYEPSPWVRERFDHGHEPDWVLHVGPPDLIFEGRYRTVVFTMWETDGLPKLARSVLNAAEAVLTASRFNCESFRECGVTTPIRQVPLGVTAAEGYYPRPMDMEGPTVFGMAARLAAGGVRKGIREGIAAFLDAFPDDPDVRLHVKLWPDCLRSVSIPVDPRVVVTTTPLRSHEMAWWYAGLTALLVPSKGEGWGLHTQQAMACGRPVIAADATGTADVFAPGCGWAVPYRREPAADIYAGTGHWAVPDRDAMAGAMREAHADRNLCAARGAYAAMIAFGNTWDRTAVRLDAVLTELGLVPAVDA